MQAKELEEELDRLASQPDGAGACRVCTGGAGILAKGDHVVTHANAAGLCAFQGTLTNLKELAATFPIQWPTNAEENSSQGAAASSAADAPNAAEMMLWLYTVLGPQALSVIRGKFSLCVFDVKQVRVVRQSVGWCSMGCRPWALFAAGVLQPSSHVLTSCLPCAARTQLRVLAARDGFGTYPLLQARTSRNSLLVRACRACSLGTHCNAWCTRPRAQGVARTHCAAGVHHAPFKPQISSAAPLLSEAHDVVAFEPGHFKWGWHASPRAFDRNEKFEPDARRRSVDALGHCGGAPGSGPARRWSMEAHSHSHAHAHAAGGRRSARAASLDHGHVGHAHARMLPPHSPASPAACGRPGGGRCSLGHSPMQGAPLPPSNLSHCSTVAPTAAAPARQPQATAAAPARQEQQQRKQQVPAPAQRGASDASRRAGAARDAFSSMAQHVQAKPFVPMAERATPVA